MYGSFANLLPFVTYKHNTLSTLMFESSCGGKISDSVWAFVATFFQSGGGLDICVVGLMGGRQGWVEEFVNRALRILLTLKI